MSKFKVGDHVEVVAEYSSYYKPGARGKIIKRDDSSVPNLIDFYSGEYERQDGAAWWANDDVLKLIRSESDDLAEARERIAALELVNTQQALLIESLQAQVAAHRVEIASRARVIDGEDLA